MKKYIFSVVLVGIQVATYAQCAMCKANAETSVNAGAKDLLSINRGIIYLLVAPYFLVFTVGMIWWWHKKKSKKAQLQ
ncbi:MAG: hypothetical protein WCP57_05115 [Bacteroidota bacterium]